MPPIKEGENWIFQPVCCCFNTSTAEQIGQRRPPTARRNWVFHLQRLKQRRWRASEAGAGCQDAKHPPFCDSFLPPIRKDTNLSSPTVISAIIFIKEYWQKSNNTALMKDIFGKDMIGKHLQSEGFGKRISRKLEGRWSKKEELWGDFNKSSLNYNGKKITVPSIFPINPQKVN